MLTVIMDNNFKLSTVKKLGGKAAGLGLSEEIPTCLRNCNVECAGKAL